MATINAMKSKRLLAPASHPEEGVDVVVGEGPEEVEGITEEVEGITEEVEGITEEVEGITEEENEGSGDETFE